MITSWRKSPTNCVKHAHTLPRTLSVVLLSLQSTWAASQPVSHRKGEFPERSRLFQPDQTLAYCFVVCRVGACFCVALFLCLAFPSILPEPVAKRRGGRFEEWETKEGEVKHRKYEGSGRTVDAVIRPRRGPSSLMLKIARVGRCLWDWRED